MNSTLPSITESPILDRILFPDYQSISRAAAEMILRWTFSAKDRDKMSELASKARAGTLTDAERALVDEYGRIDSFISMSKSKARQALNNATEQSFDVAIVQITQ